MQQAHSADAFSGKMARDAVERDAVAVHRWVTKVFIERHKYPCFQPHLSACCSAAAKPGTLHARQHLAPCPGPEDFFFGATWPLSPGFGREAKNKPGPTPPAPWLRTREALMGMPKETHMSIQIGFSAQTKCSQTQEGKPHWVWSTSAWYCKDPLDKQASSDLFVLFYFGEVRT